MVDFTAKNMRDTAVELFSNKKSKGQVNRKSSRRFSDSEGEFWEARTLAGEFVADYEVTPRVQFWTITPAKTGKWIELNPYDAGDYNESLARVMDSSNPPKPRFLEARGTVKAVMLFVDFDRDRARGQHWADEKKIMERLVGTAKDWLDQESFGAAELQVQSVSGWQSLSKSAADYADPGCRCVSGHMRTFVEDTVAEFPQIDFDQFQIVYIVAARSDDFTLSPAFVEQPVSAPKGEVGFAVVFGRDSYTSNQFLLLHETCHLFGLPDLYDGGEGPAGGYSAAGVSPWDLMADQDRAQHLLGWHRLKLGWLKYSQAVFIYSNGVLEIELAGWSTPNGVKLVTIPFTMSSPADFAKASLAYVVEVAPAVAGPSPGVLVYTVHSAVPTWQRPIQLRGGNDRLYASPIPVGESFSHLSGSIEVKVVAAVGDGFRVKVTIG